MTTAIYARVSTQRQAQAQGIEQQLERLQDYAQSQGWQVNADNIFRDDGLSGAKLKRPGLDRLRDKVATAQLQRILVTAPDRLARKFVHQALLVEEFQRQGCQVEFLERPMSQDPHDQLLLQIRGAVAEYERSLIADRMRRGRLNKMKAGLLLPWTFAPYGYQLDVERPRDPTGVRLDEAQAAIIREIFSCYVEDNYSLVGLSQHLHRLGISSPRGNPAWTSASLRGILKNPIYTGQVFANKSRPCTAQQRRSPLQPVGPGVSTKALEPSEWILVARIPAIISQEQFEAAQVKLQQNQRFAKRNNKTHDYLLRALVSCGHCQGTCVSCHRGARYRYYVCRSKTVSKHLSAGVRCSAPYIPAQQLEQLVWNDLCQVLQHPEMIANAMERVQGGHWLPQELQARRLNLQRGQRNLRQQLERLTQAYLNGVMQLEEYERRRSEIETSRSALETQEQQLLQQANQQMEIAKLSAGVKDFCQRVQAGLEQADFKRRRELVELLIDRVVVTNEEVEIRYVIPTSLPGEKSRFCHLRIDYFNNNLRLKGKRKLIVSGGIFLV